MSGTTGGGIYYVGHITAEYVEGLVTAYVQLNPVYERQWFNQKLQLYTGLRKVLAVV